MTLRAGKAHGRPLRPWSARLTYFLLSYFGLLLTVPQVVWTEMQYSSTARDTSASGCTIRKLPRAKGAHGLEACSRYRRVSVWTGEWRIRWYRSVLQWIWWVCASADDHSLRLSLCRRATVPRSVRHHRLHQTQLALVPESSSMSSVDMHQKLVYFSIVMSPKSTTVLSRSGVLL